MDTGTGMSNQMDYKLPYKDFVSEKEKFLLA
jgi:hypothetical protein